MKRILGVLIFTLLGTTALRAQSEVQELPLPQIYLLQVSILRTEPHQQIPGQILPDNPIPVLPSLQDGPAPCPLGEGKSCALLGGRAYFSDPIHMTEHDATWARAARNPAMLVGFALNFAANVADIEGTQSCLHAHTCREANPLFGSDPSRARSYGLCIPIDLVAYAGFALVKKEGRGNLAFGLLWGSTAAHIYFASAAFSYAHVASTGANSARRH
jgi:hypothetical protein